MKPASPSVEFTPVAVDGVERVASCLVMPERLQLTLTDGGRVDVMFEGIARFPRPERLWRALHRLGLRRARVPVGERDWCQPEGRQFFRFFTKPPLVLYLPEDRHLGYGSTVFARIQETLARGGFGTHDLA